MNSEFLFGVSLTASFLAGVLALFAPCCITFLFPSYLGTVFRDGKKVALYTLVFALGLSFILIPVALGFRFIIYFLDAYHKQIYYAGGFFLMFMGLMTLKPLFHLPQLFHMEPKIGRRVNAGSVFGLGLMSGLTSSCCAPVLFAAVTLTTLSPTLLQAAVVSFAYVLGIVFPLFLLSLGYKGVSNRFSGGNRQKLYTVLKYTGASIFIASGMLIAVFNYLDKIQMNQMEKYGRNIRMTVLEAGRLFQNPVLDIAAFAAVIFLFYLTVRLFRKSDTV